MKNIYISAVLFLFLPVTCIAAGWTAQDVRIDSIKYESNLMIIKVSGGNFNLYDDCDTTGQLILQDETKRGDRQISMVLAALMAGKDTSFYTVGCVTAWSNKYPKVTSVKVDN